MKEKRERILAEVTAQRVRETQTIAKHLEISLNELLHRQNLRLAELIEMQQRGLPAARLPDGQGGQATMSQPLAANIKQTEDRLDELNGRLERRRAELQQERQCMIGDIQYLARAWVLPHPDARRLNSRRWSATRKSSASPSSMLSRRRRRAVAGWRAWNRTIAALT
jgi:hypothetical protein